MVPLQENLLYLSEVPDDVYNYDLKSIEYF